MLEIYASNACYKESEELVQKYVTLITDFHQRMMGYESFEALK
jgi:hypothetical protein